MHRNIHVTDFCNRVRNLLSMFILNRSERTYGNLYKEIRRDKGFECLVFLDFDQLTELKKAVNDYLYGPNIGVLKIQNDPRWSDDRKQFVEAEQREFLSRICQARRQCSEKALREKCPPWLPSKIYHEALMNKIKHNAYEAVVKAPYAYPADNKGLIHDVVVLLYRGKQVGEVINFPVDPREKADLTAAINTAKSKVFECYNKYETHFKEFLPDDYGVWLYIDDYPDDDDSDADDNMLFSGTSFTLAVAVGIWACLEKVRINSTVAFSGKVDLDDENSNKITYVYLKAKAARLSGIKQFFASIDYSQELDACSGVIDARRIQLKIQPNQRPDDTQVISVSSLKDLWSGASGIKGMNIIPLPRWRLVCTLILERAIQNILWVLVSALFIALITGISWFHFDKPILVPYSFRVRPAEMVGYPGDAKAQVVYAQFHSRLGTTAWLRLASFLYGRSYWIECPSNVSPMELLIDDANYGFEVMYTVPLSNEAGQFQLKYRDGSSIATYGVSVKAISRIPRGG